MGGDSARIHTAWHSDRSLGKAKRLGVISPAARPGSSRLRLPEPLRVSALRVTIPCPGALPSPSAGLQRASEALRAMRPPYPLSSPPLRSWPTHSASSLRLLSSPSGPVPLSMLGTGEDADPQHQPRARSFTTHCATPASVPASHTGLLNQKLPPTKLR